MNMKLGGPCAKTSPAPVEQARERPAAYRLHCVLSSGTLALLLQELVKLLLDVAEPLLESLDLVRGLGRCRFLEHELRLNPALHGLGYVRDGSLSHDKLGSFSVFDLL